MHQKRDYQEDNTRARSQGIHIPITKPKKEKFKGAYDDMKDVVFCISRSQADNYRHMIMRLQVVTEVGYSAAVLLAVRDLKERPVMIK